MHELAFVRLLFVIQVSTGEGKSLIIASLAIVKALQGQNVDIVTRRDSPQNQIIIEVTVVQ